MTAHFIDIHALLKQELERAKTRIQVAVAWFTDQSLYVLLSKKASEGVSVTVIMRNDAINLNSGGIKWQEFIDAKDATLYFSNESLFLHHKFCIIDNNVLISGSYNWTYRAQRNRENVVCGSQAELVKMFGTEFNDLLDNARQVTDINVEMVERPPATTTFLLEEASIEIKFKNEAQTNRALGTDYEQLLKDASAAYCQKEYSAAEKLANKAMIIRPKGVGAYVLIAGILWRTERYDEAVKVIKKAEGFGVKDAALWNVCGLALEGIKRFKEAIDYFDLSIAKAPDFSIFYGNKCMALDAWGRESMGDKVVPEAIRVANKEIKDYQNGNDKHRLLQAYIVCANVRSDRPEKRKYAQSASEIFYEIPINERDMHDLDDINKNLN